MKWSVEDDAGEVEGDHPNGLVHDLADAEIAADTGEHICLHGFHAMPGGRIWRRVLTVEGNKPGAGLEVVDAALAAVREAFERRRDAA